MPTRSTSSARFIEFCMGYCKLPTATAPAVRAAVKTVVSCRCFVKGTEFLFPVTVQNATSENSSILGFVNKSKSL